MWFYLCKCGVDGPNSVCLSVHPFVAKGNNLLLISNENSISELLVDCVASFMCFVPTAACLTLTVQCI